MGYHRILDCNTGCCDTPEALASVTRTGAVLNFADTKGKQTTIDLTELLPNLNALVSVERSGNKLDFADSKGNITSINLADMMPSFDGVTDVAGTALGIRVTLGNDQSKDIDLSKLYTAPVALKSVARNGTTLTFTDTAGNAHTVELDAVPEVPVAYKDAKLNGSTLRFTDTAGATHDVNLASLIPASKADRFLSGVSYDKKTNTLMFRTSADGEADTTFEVNVSDLLPVAAGTGLQGDGTAASPLRLDVANLAGGGLVAGAGTLNVNYDPTTMELKNGKLAAKQPVVPTVGHRLLANDGVTVLGNLINPVNEALDHV